MRHKVGMCALVATLAASGVLLAPGSASAAIPGRTESPVHWEYFQDFCGVGVDWDTGWVPSGSDVQVRVQFRIACEFETAADGKGVLVWPPATQLFFQGDPRGGEFSQAIGVFFDARLRWDISTPVGDSRGEMPIPYVPHIDIGCLDRGMQYTPFLLSGNPDRPAHLLCQVPRFLVFSYDILDLVLPEISAFASVNIKIYLSIDLHSYLQGNKIIVSEHEQEIVEEYGRAFVYPRGSPMLNLTAQYIADLSHQMIVTIHPEVEFEVLGFDFGFDIIDVGIPIPEMSDQWIFDPQELTFYFPDIEAAPELDFGRTQVGRPRMKRFAVENVGFQDLQIYARTGLPFGVDPRLGDPEEPPITIPAPGLEDVIVSFDPDGEGTARGVLRFETNDPDEPWVDVRLIGEATYDDVGEYTDPDDCEGEECFTGGGWATTGCGCRTAAGSRHTGPLAAALAVLAAALLGARRRRSG